MQALKKQDDYEFVGENRPIDQDDLLFDPDNGELYSTGKLLKMVTKAVLPEIAFLQGQPKEEIAERADQLLASFESVGIVSQVFKARSVGNYPYSRQNKFLEEVATLSFKGNTVVKVHFPTVGYEVVSRKYVGTLGVYDPRYGVVSCNKVSHVVNGMAEFPKGEEFITFTLQTCTNLYNFQWDDEGISYLGEGELIYGYYIRSVLQHVLLMGIPSAYVQSTELQWYHFLMMDETKDYIINIDGISMLLMGVKKMVKEMYLTHPPRYVLDKSMAHGYRRKEGTRYFVDIDTQEVLRRTDRPVETQHTAIHLVNDAVTVLEFKKKVRMLDTRIVNDKKYVVNLLDPNADILASQDLLNRVPFFRRLRKGTSRNSYVQQAVMDSGWAYVEDTMSVGTQAIFMGNNRIYVQKQSNFISGKEFDESMYYKRVYFRVESLVYDNSFECQLGRLLSFVILPPSKITEILNDGREEIAQSTIVKTETGMDQLFSVIASNNNLLTPRLMSLVGHREEKPEMAMVWNDSVAVADVTKGWQAHSYISPEMVKLKMKDSIPLKRFTPKSELYDKKFTLL